MSKGVKTSGKKGGKPAHPKQAKTKKTSELVCCDKCQDYHACEEKGVCCEFCDHFFKDKCHLYVDLKIEELTKASIELSDYRGDDYGIDDYEQYESESNVGD